MYLSDEEIQILAKKMLSWLKVGGHLFFRESCYHQSGNKKRGENPTEYRTPMQYVELCESVQEEDVLNPGKFYALNPIFGKSIEAYITVSLLNLSCIFCMLVHSFHFTTKACGCSTRTVHS
jgi:phosphoethanolamine N-methyltransferase